MNETAPAQKQDIDRLSSLLAAILEELRAIRRDVGLLKPKGEGT